MSIEYYIGLFTGLSFGVSCYIMGKYFGRKETMYFVIKQLNRLEKTKVTEGSS